MGNDYKVPSYKGGLSELETYLDGVLPPAIAAKFTEDANKLAAHHPPALMVKTGDNGPMFKLKNAVGKDVNLADLLLIGPVVLVFYRGGWCPYCNLQLRTYQEILPQIKMVNGSLVAISPQIPDESLNMIEKNQLKFEVLSDPGNKVASLYTTVFKNSDETINAMKSLGVDLRSFYSDNSDEIPVPAVFVIDPNGKIIFAKSEGDDHRQRVEPADILSVLESSFDKIS